MVCIIVLIVKSHKYNKFARKLDREEVSNKTERKKQSLRDILK